MPLPTKDSPSKEKEFSVTILVSEHEKNKIVDLLHKAKTIISKKVEKVMGKKPKTDITNVDALATVLENWMDRAVSEEREDKRLEERLIKEQERQVETLLMDGKPSPVTYPMIPTVEVDNPVDLPSDSDLGEDLEVARLTSPRLLQPPRRKPPPPTECLSPTRSLSPCEVPCPFGNRPENELYPPRLRRPSSLYGVGAAAASSRPASRQVSLSPSVVGKEEEVQEEEWEYEDDFVAEVEEEEYTEKVHKYTRPDSFIVPIGGVWNPDPMEAEVRWSTVETVVEEKEVKKETKCEAGGGEGEEACQRVWRLHPVLLEPNPPPVPPPHQTNPIRTAAHRTPVTHRVTNVLPHTSIHPLTTLPRLPQGQHL